MSELKRTAAEAHFPDLHISKTPRTLPPTLSRTSSVTTEMDEPAGADGYSSSLSNALKGISGFIVTLWPFRDYPEIDVTSSVPSLSSSTETSSTESPATPPTVDANKNKPRLPSNNSPTNLIASSSTSFSSRPPIIKSSSPSASPSVTSTSPNAKTQRSQHQTTVPDSPYHQDLLQKVLSSSRSPRPSGFGVQKRYRKPHIYQHEHKQNVKDALSRKLYELNVGKGYSSDFETFKGYMQYKRRLDNLERVGAIQGHNKRVSHIPVLPDDEVQYLKKALEKATKSLQSPKPPKPYSPSLEQLNDLIKARNQRTHERLHPKKKPLPERLAPDELKEVENLLRKRGVVSKAGREQVADKDLLRLRPGTWLNDEIINFYGQLIVSRSEESDASKDDSNKPLKAHYFSTFFWPKLYDSGYEKGRIAKWTKKIDIFSKDVILMAINHGNSHWTSAAINFKAKRLEAYDSMGYKREEVYNTLRNYLDEEHKNKKKKPFDFTGWVDHYVEDYPTQENGYDCGVFTCQSLEYISRGADFNFSQKNMTYLRQRMMLEIGRAKLYVKG